MKKYVIAALGGFLLASCTLSPHKQHALTTTREEGCGHCHYLIYKNWKITYKPYEQVPVPGSTIAPGPFPQYHERRERETGEDGTAIIPTGKVCSTCHAGAQSPEGVCTRGKSGFK